MRLTLSLSISDIEPCRVSLIRLTQRVARMLDQVARAAALARPPAALVLPTLVLIKEVQQSEVLMSSWAHRLYPVLPK